MAGETIHIGGASAICRVCARLGLELDEAANREHRERIQRSKQRCRRLYDPRPRRTLMIVRHARASVES
jgi:hypothetical protein